MIALTTVFAGAQVTVRGTVTNKRTGEPLELVTVFTDGTQIGTTTAQDSIFELEMPR